MKYENIMDPVIAWLGLGRNFTETLRRCAVEAEVHSNIARMVHRYGGSGFPLHWPLLAVGRSVTVAADGPPTTMVDSLDVSYLSMGGLGHVTREKLSSTVIAAAIHDGIFLTYDPISSSFQESELHTQLLQILDDINALAQLEGDDWAARILSTIPRTGSAEIDSKDLVIAITFGYRAENLFNGLLRAAHLLRGNAIGSISTPRMPVTAYGEKEAAKIRNESVTGAEVAVLIENEVHPLGHKLPPELAAATRESRVLDLERTFRRLYQDSSKDIEISEEAIHNMAEDVADRMVVSEDQMLPPVTSNED